MTVAANGTDTVELDHASLNVAGDYGIVAATDWYYMPTQLANALPNWDQIQPAMAAAQNLTICNGSIVQGQANGYGSLPIYAAYMPGLTIQNVNTLSTGIDTGAVYAAYSSNGLVISDCVFRNTSDEVANRKSMDGAQVHVDFASGPVTVSGNQFLGSPQIGIFGRNDSNLTISNNTIESNSVVGDGYGILVQPGRSLRDLGKHHHHGRRREQPGNHDRRLQRRRRLRPNLRQLRGHPGAAEPGVRP